MHFLPIHTPLIHAGDDLVKILRDQSDLQDGDILVVSSKAVATWENAFVDLVKGGATKRALEEATITGRDAGFCEAVFTETARMNGRIVGRCPGAMLCVLHPVPETTIVAANAGMDQSNVPEGKALGWPHDPPASITKLRSSLGKNVAVIITDGCCIPLRTGISGYALACGGMDPVRDERGKPDLFGKPLRITQDAIADQLCATANAIMGNAAQATPAVIIRDHGFPFSDFLGWIPTFPPQEDLFRDVIRL